MSYNSTAGEMQAALESMSPWLKGAQVTRSTTAEDVRGFTWTITFPKALGNTPLLDVNAAGLSGDDVFAHTVEVQRGSVVAVQRIATAASSVLTGGFKLSFKGLETGLIPVGASALDLKGELENLSPLEPNVTMRSVDVESVAKARARTSASLMPSRMS